MLGIGQTTTGCDSFLLNRQQGVRRLSAGKTGRIGGGIFEVLDQVMTDLDGFGGGKVRKRVQGNDGNKSEQYPTAYRVIFCKILS